MKKQITATLTAILLLTSITACQDCGLENRSGEQSSAANNSAPSSQNESGVPESGTEKIESEPQEAAAGIYGETEIPDIPCGESDDGRANDLLNSEELKQCLNSMVFETHSFGDYTIKLVGDRVRTDNVNFPGRIYTKNLRAEAERNGEKIESNSGYNGHVTYEYQFCSEYVLFADKIGSYLDVYDLSVPVAAMRYWFGDETKKTVMKAVEFASILNDELATGYVGVFEKGTGIMLNSDTTSGDRLIFNTEDGYVCRVAAFEADEFKLVDEKTLVDEEAGLKYTFDFTNPLPFELYTVERLGS